jgi:hypothetical protein
MEPTEVDYDAVKRRYPHLVALASRRGVVAIGDGRQWRPGGCAECSSACPCPSRIAAPNHPARKDTPTSCAWNDESCVSVRSAESANAFSVSRETWTSRSTASLSARIVRLAWTVAARWRRCDTGPRTSAAMAESPPQTLQIPDWCGCPTEYLPVPLGDGWWSLVLIWDLIGPRTRCDGGSLPSRTGRVTHMIATLKMA